MKREKFALLGHANKGIFCEYCNYFTANKKDFNKHLATRKHMKNVEISNKSPKKIPTIKIETDQTTALKKKNQQKRSTGEKFLCKYLAENKNKKKEKNEIFSCEHCSKEFSYKSWLCRHYKTCHKNPQNICVTVNSVNARGFFCKKCNKSYKYKGAYEKHIRSCSADDNIYTNNVVIESENTKLNDALTEKVIKLLEKSEENNKKLFERILTSEKEKNIINNNISYNHIKNGNQVNINLFLNEDCKNAMNLTEFVSKVKLSIEDLIYTRDNGYVKGISNIFLKELEDMKITERPIHCSNKEEQKFYVKDKNKWETDRKNEKINKSIDEVARKQFAQIKEWEKNNPEWTSTDDGLSEYMDITRIIMGGSNEIERIKNKELIKREIKDKVEIVPIDEEINNSETDKNDESKVYDNSYNKFDIQ